METCPASSSGWMSLSCSSSLVASSNCGIIRERRKRDELARESLYERNSNVRERVVGVMDDEAIAVPVANSARSGGIAGSYAVA